MPPCLCRSCDRPAALLKQIFKWFKSLVQPLKAHADLAAQSQLLLMWLGRQARYYCAMRKSRPRGRSTAPGLELSNCAGVVGGGSPGGAEQPAEASAPAPCPPPSTVTSVRSPALSMWSTGCRCGPDSLMYNQVTRPAVKPSAARSPSEVPTGALPRLRTEGSE